MIFSQLQAFSLGFVKSFYLKIFYLKNGNYSLSTKLYDLSDVNNFSPFSKFEFSSDYSQPGFFIK